MDVNAAYIKEQRTAKNWTQQHLADACGVSLRTVQRVERYGNASNETVSALASVFEIQAADIIVPESPVETYESVPKSPWVERIVLMATSSVFGYIVAVFTG